MVEDAAYFAVVEAPSPSVARRLSRVSANHPCNLVGPGNHPHSQFTAAGK